MNWPFGLDEIASAIMLRVLAWWAVFGCTLLVVAVLVGSVAPPPEDRD